MRAKATLSEPLVNTLFAGTLGSYRETIETHSYFLSDFKLNYEIIYTTHKENV
jgi:hypothetical protein